MRKGAYITLQENIKKFSDFVNEFLAAGLDGDRKFEYSDFVATESYVNVFDMYPQLSELEIMENMRQALVYARQPAPFLNSTKYMKEAAKMICLNTMPLILEAKNVAREIKPEKDPDKKDVMIQLIRKYQNTRSELNETAKQYGYNIEDATDLWIKHYKKHSTDLIGVLNDFKNRDQGIEFEVEFNNAMFKLIEYDYDYSYDDSGFYKAYKKIENLLSSCDDMEALIGLIKAEYKIGEDEISPDEVQNLKQEIENLKERNKKLLQQLLDPSSYQEPKLTLRFGRIDVEEVETLVNELLEIVTYASSFEEGKFDLRVPIEQMERIYSKIKNGLENTEFLTLFAQSQNILDNLYNFSDDPKGLFDITKMYVQNVRLQFDKYHQRMGRKGNLRTSI